LRKNGLRRDDHTSVNRTLARAVLHTQVPVNLREKSRFFKATF